MATCRLLGPHKSRAGLPRHSLPWDRDIRVNEELLLLSTLIAPSGGTEGLLASPRGHCHREGFLEEVALEAGAH